MNEITKGQNPILFVRNVPFSTTVEDVKTLFERYGAVRQIRLGNGPGTRGTAYVVYGHPRDAKQAAMKLTGYALHGRYLIVGFWQPPGHRHTQQQQRSDARTADSASTA
jgi:pre-mRNA branch site protein p14